VSDDSGIIKPMNILILPKHGDISASTRHRYLQFIPYLEDAGYKVTVSPLFDNNYLRMKHQGTGDLRNYLQAIWYRLKLLTTIRSYDLVLLYKEAFPYVPAVYEYLLASLGVRYLVDFDDAVHEQYTHHKNPVVRFLLSGKIRNVIRNAAGVIVCNRCLEGYASRYHSRVNLVPTVVDESRFVPRKQQKPSTGIIGWIGSPSTARYLLEIQSPLKRVQELTGCRIVIIGSGKVRLNSIKAEYIAWDIKTEIDWIQSFSVGIMPLTDDPWSRGKCGFKLIQYLACGVPVVASPVGVNEEIVETGVSGYLATSEDEWEAAMIKLLTDDTVRESMSRAGRKKVETCYSLEGAAKSLLQAIGRLENES